MRYRFKSSKMMNGIVIALVVFLAIFFIYTIIKQVQESHKQNDPKLKEIVARLTPAFPSMQNLDFYEGEKSYTINKQKVYLCLKDENGAYYDDNVLIYVILHEYSHSICKSIGHTVEFHELFEDVLKKATDLGLFNPSVPIPHNYCNWNK